MTRRTGNSSARADRSRELRAAAVAVILLAALVVAVFTKSNPFADPFKISADFSTAAQLRPGSEVRIGGLKIGEVSAIDAGPGTSSRVTMKIDEREVPIRTDARLTLKPRLVLEGNGYVDVQPGSPAAPELARGGRIPLSHTAVRVQLDQALDTFTAPTRDALQDVTRELSRGLSGEPRAAGVSPRPGHEDLRIAIKELNGALGDVSVAARAVQGRRRGDLRAAAGGTGAVTRQLARDPQALSDLITSYSHLSETLAGRDAQLAESIRGFAATLRPAPAQLHAIDGALPALTRFARVLTPALRAAPPALTALKGTVGEIRRAVQPAELPALVTQLRPVTSALPALQRRLTATLPQATAIGRCLTKTVIPALDKTIEDGPNSTGRPVWQDAVHMATSLAGAASAFDANGGTLRLGVTEGEQAIGLNLPDFGVLEGVMPKGETGLNPTWLGYGVDPPFRPDMTCSEQVVPDYDARKKPGIPATMKRRSATGGNVATGQDLAGLRKLLSLPASEMLTTLVTGKAAR
jgi:phospholipid/cholesterol/gamma-HCH transport system substrate-binding protein